MAEGKPFPGFGTNEFAYHVPPPGKAHHLEALAVARHLGEMEYHANWQRQMKLERAQETLAKWREAVLEKVGPSDWKRFLDFSRSQEASRYGVKDFQHDPTSWRRLAVAKRKARERGLAMLKAAGVKPSELKEIHRTYARSLDKILGRGLDPSPGGLEKVEERHVPSAILHHKTNPWSIRTPPYDGWAWSYWWYRWGGSDPDVTRYLDSATGSVGTRSSYANFSAGDFDGLVIEYDTNVGFWHYAPTAGRVEMWIKARCSRAWYSVYLDDEWGWSDSDTWMRSYLTANVSPAMADEDRTQNWWAETWGNPDSTTYAGDLYAAGSAAWFHLTTSDAIPGGAWTYIKIGTFDRHSSFLNDVSTFAVMRNRWFLEEVQYRIV